MLGKVMARYVVVMLLAVASSLIPSGCGGMFQSEKRGLPPTEQTRSRVQRMLSTSWNVASLGGATFAEAMVARNGKSGKAISLIGSFVRTHSEGDKDQPEESAPGFYYDEWLGLWVQVEEHSAGSRLLLYEDEEKTREAGIIESTYPVPTNAYPQTFTYRYDIRAGWQAGSRGEYVVTIWSETSGLMRYEYRQGDGSRGQGSSRWNETGGEWSNRHESSDGFWAEDSGTFFVDGSGRTQSRNSLGYSSRFEYYPDGSGSGVIEGPDAGLPAMITWSVEGKMTIRWADGTVEEFNLWDVWVGDDDGEG